jgi:hypothetical protein
VAAALNCRVGETVQAYSQIGEELYGSGNRRRRWSLSGASVAIYRLMQRQAFLPEDVQRLGDAYEHALKELGLVDRNDPLTETIAQLIIEVAQTGEKDPARICALAIEGISKPS